MKQLADRPSSSFTANTKKNPKEECKAVRTKSRMEIQAEEGRVDQKVEGFKQQLVAQPTSISRSRAKHEISALSATVVLSRLNARLALSSNPLTCAKAWVALSATSQIQSLFKACFVQN